MIKLRSKWETDRPFNLLSWGHWFTFANLIMAMVFSFFYISAAPAPSSFIGWVYLLTNWVGHFAFLSLSCFILTIFPIITFFPYKKHIRGVAALLASLFQLLLFLDLLAFLGLGYHLSAASISQLREVEDLYVATMGNGYWLLLLGVFLLILVYQFFVSNLTWKRIHQLQASTLRKILPSLLVSFFFVSHVIHIWADATLDSDIAKQNNLFPLSYPMTAKSLLAKYQLIDLQQYQINKSEQVQVANQQFKIKPIQALQCDFDSTQHLNVSFYNESQRASIQTWLKTNNVNYQFSNQLILSQDLDTNVYNFSTGLPGLYKELAPDHQRDINQIFDQELISISVATGPFDTKQPLLKPSQGKVYVFINSDPKYLYYKANVILIGFEKVKSLTLSAQNIIASFLANKVNCEQFVNRNLIDASLSELSNDYLHTNYHQGYFNIVFKDKVMLFNQGKLMSNRTFSNDKEVEELLDLPHVQKAIRKITALRVTSNNN